MSSRLQQGAVLSVLRTYGLEKFAGPRSLLLSAAKHLGPLKGYSAMGGGLGAGIGSIQGFRADDPNESFEHHVGAGLRGALLGGAIGTVGGTAAGAAFKKFAPNKFQALAEGPFADAEANLARKGREGLFDEHIQRELAKDPTGNSIPAEHWEAVHNRIDDPLLKPKFYAQKAYEYWMHPATRVVGGMLLGREAASRYSNSVADYRLQQLASRKGRAEAAPGHENENSELEAIKARLRMGDYNQYTRF